MENPLRETEVWPYLGIRYVYGIATEVLATAGLAVVANPHVIELCHSSIDEARLVRKENL